MAEGIFAALLRATANSLGSHLRQDEARALVLELNRLYEIEAAAVAYRDAPIESDVHDNAGDMYHRLLGLLPKRGA